MHIPQPSQEQQHKLNKEPHMALTKQITYETVTAIGTQIDYNVQSSVTDAEGVTTTQYFPAKVCIYMTGTSADGQTNPVMQESYIGTPKATPYTPQQLYTLIKSAQGLPALAPLLKSAYVAAVNVVVA